MHNGLYLCPDRMSLGKREAQTDSYLIHSEDEKVTCSMTRFSVQWLTRLKSMRRSSYVGLGLLPDSFWLMVVDPKAQASTWLLSSQKPPVRLPCGILTNWYLTSSKSARESLFGLLQGTFTISHNYLIFIVNQHNQLQGGIPNTSRVYTARGGAKHGIYKGWR